MGSTVSRRDPGVAEFDNWVSSQLWVSEPRQSSGDFRAPRVRQPVSFSQVYVESLRDCSAWTMDMWCALRSTLLPSLGRRRRLCLSSGPPFMDLPERQDSWPSPRDPDLQAMYNQGHSSEYPLGITVQPTDLRLFSEGSRKSSPSSRQLPFTGHLLYARHGAWEDDRTAHSSCQSEFWVWVLLWLCMAEWFNIFSFNPYINPSERRLSNSLMKHEAKKFQV